MPAFHFYSGLYDLSYRIFFSTYELLAFVVHLFYFILYVLFTFYICPEYSHRFWVALWDIWIKCFLTWKHGHFFFLLHLSSFSHASVHGSLTLPFIILALIWSIDFKNQKFSCLKVVISLRYWKCVF